jgi:hypothetical protein
MQSRGRLSLAWRLRAGLRTLSRFTPGMGGSDGQTARGIRSRGGELRRSSPFAWQGPQSTRSGKPGSQETPGLIAVALAAQISQLPSANFRAHVAELADAYGSGPYGATRGGSSPLVSIAEVDRAVPCSMLKSGGGAAIVCHRPRSGRSTSAPKPIGGFISPGFNPLGGILALSDGDDENLRRYSLL